jgi:anthranilate synthase
MHGKPSRISHRGGQLFQDIPPLFTAGRYHSLHATRVPACLKVSATDEAGVVMAVEHAQLPVTAVQFHPESIMSLEHRAGLQLISNVVESVARRTALEKTG